MGRPKIKEHWEELIKGYTENEPRLGPLGIRPKLEQAAKEVEAAGQVGKDKLGPIPGLRTIGRIQQRFRDLPGKERLRYRQLRWPEDMENGLLPWEAGLAALELLRWRMLRGLSRPLIGQVRWLWRISTLAPGALFDERYTAARWLCALEVAGAAASGEDLKRAVELWLAFTPWRSGADASAYADVLGGAPAFPHGASLTVQAEALGDFMIAFDGIGISEGALRASAELIQQRMGSEDEGSAQCEDISADGEQHGQPSSASGTTKAVGDSSAGIPASKRGRRPRKS